jgi:formylglycine-generating enzyme required for sulfatase activity
MTFFKNKKIYIIILLALAAVIAGTVVFNLDIVLRFARAYQNGTLTMQKIRFDLAAFNFNKKNLVVPVDIKTSVVDSMEQMYVPAGKFIMGKVDTISKGAAPQHIVYLDAFWMDRVEVSNAMYLKCLKAGGCTSLVSDNTRYKNWIYRNHPVVYVNWYQAQAYCQWTGRHLPTEAQWEKAARGTDGRMYPWGNDAPNPTLANYSSSLIHESVSVYRYPLGASPYGVLNMSGNAREWVMDWFDPTYYSISPYKNPPGPQIGFERSLRSGSYNEDGREIFALKRYSHEPQSAGLSRGFRCAEDASTN